MDVWVVVHGWCCMCVIGGGAWAVIQGLMVMDGDTWVRGYMDTHSERKLDLKPLAFVASTLCIHNNHPNIMSTPTGENIHIAPGDESHNNT
eukprot:8541634-Heterocapsa_arctica.AAC.1